MFIQYDKKMPNDVICTVHRIRTLEIDDFGIKAVINSYTDTDSSAPIRWQDTYTLPPGTNTVSDALAWLITPVGDFAHGTIGEDPNAFETARDAMWQRIKYVRDASEGNGSVTPFGRVDTDPESLLRITGAVQAATIAITAGDALALDWTMADNSVVTMDAEMLVAMGRAVALHVDACHQRGRELRQLVEAAETEGDLTAIESEIIVGWPN